MYASVAPNHFKYLGLIGNVDIVKYKPSLPWGVLSLFPKGNIVH